jgi:hypothetical protein
MRVLAAIMISISLITVALFARALATVDDPSPAVDVTQVAAR